MNLTEMMLVLGLADRMVGYTGNSGWKTLDADMTKGVEALPDLSSKYPTREVLAGADADFFLAGWNYGMKVGREVTPETLEPFGIAAQMREFMISNPALAYIDAVRNDRFVVLEYVPATPGPRNIKAVKTLAAAFRAE